MWKILNILGHSALLINKILFYYLYTPKSSQVEFGAH